MTSARIKNMEIKSEIMIDQICSVCGKHFQSIEEFSYCSAQCFFKKVKRDKRELIKKAVENGKEKEE